MQGQWFDCMKRNILICPYYMTYLLFAVYLVLFSWLITRVKFIQQSGLPNYWLIGLFVLKVAAGVAYGWFYTTIPNYEQSADTWKFFSDSKADRPFCILRSKNFFHRM